MSFVEPADGAVTPTPSIHLNVELNKIMNDQNNNTPASGTEEKLFFLHYRQLRDATPGELGTDPTKELYVDSRGGATVGFVMPQEGSDLGVLYTTSAVHPRDNYSKRMGRIKTCGRFKSERRVQVTKFTDKKEFIEAMDAYYEKLGLARHFKKRAPRKVEIPAEQAA